MKELGIVVPRQIQDAIKKEGSNLGFILTLAARKEIEKRYKFVEERIAIEDTVLDIGCGLGDGLKFLKRAKNVFSIDISPERVSKAISLNEEFSNISISQMNATDLNFPANSFDKIIAMEVIEHIEDYRKMLSEARRVLRDEGTLILSTPNVDVTKQITSDEHVKEFGKDELSDILFKFFAEIELFGYGKSKNNLLSSSYFGIRKTPFYTLYRCLPLPLKSAIHYPIYKFLWGQGEIYPLKADDLPLGLIAVCAKPKK